MIKWLLKPSQVSFHAQTDEEDIILFQTEEGEVVLTKAEVEALSQEIKHVYFSNAEAKIAVKKICYAASKQS